MRNFQRLGIASVVIVYLLILVGGVVRSTGSGMGCPDWPRCFGRIIPPTNESELPPDYQEKYKDHGYATMKFNVVKTWIEYFNRLLGALTGLVVMAFFISSFALKNTHKNITALSGLVLLLVIIEGLIGKYVVSTNLKPVMVSVHMWGSIVVILLLIYTIAKSRREVLEKEDVKEVGKLRNLNLVLIALTVVQVVLGTMVRQEVDVISLQLDYSQRETWISRLGNSFYIHRSFSILLVLSHFYFFYLIKRLAQKGVLQKLNTVLILLLIIETVAGILLGYFDIPAVVQPFHMLLATLLLGIQFLIFTILSFSIRKKSELSYSI